MFADNELLRAHGVIILRKLTMIRFTDEYITGTKKPLLEAVFLYLKNGGEGGIRTLDGS